MSIQTSSPAISLYGVGAGPISSSQFPSTAITMQRAPTIYDVRNDFGFFPVGQLWVDAPLGATYFLANIANGNPPTATWTACGGGALSLSSITTNLGITYPVSNQVTLIGDDTQFTFTSVGAVITCSAPGTSIGAFLCNGQVNINGTIAVSGGNFVRQQPQSKDVHLAVGNGRVAGGAAVGFVTLALGAQSVYTTAVTANSIIRLYRQSVGASTALGIPTISHIVPGVVFTIVSCGFSNATNIQDQDASVIFWEIIN